MFRKLLTAFLLLFSLNLYADVVKWVDSEGKTHYSNKAPKKNKKSAQKIEFTQYKKPKLIEGDIVPVVDWSKDFTQVGNSYQLNTHLKNKQLEIKRSRQRKQSKKTEPSIAELRAQCDITREERLAPARAEAIEECIVKNERQTKNVVAYCERFNRTFGDEQHGGFYVFKHGRYRNVIGTSRQRLFHNIPECRRLYRAEDRRSRLNRGYRD